MTVTELPGNEYQKGLKAYHARRKAAEKAAEETSENSAPIDPVVSEKSGDN